MRSLDWDYITRKNKTVSPEEFANSLAKVGIPIKEAKKGDY